MNLAQRRSLAAAAVVLGVVVSACSGSATPADTATSSIPADQTTESETAGSTPSTPSSIAPASTVADDAAAPPDDDPVVAGGPTAAPVRNPLSHRPIYFVLPDRFANGDPSNDTAGLDGGPLDHGFLPEDRGYHHGGDLAGLTARLPYLDELGIGAIWITPPFTNRFVQGDGTVAGSSSSYHGYWQIDWSRIDPHLGSEADMRAFVDAAHARDIAVIFDIVVNHTGDVITYEEGSFAYVGSGSAPYLDATGTPFDPSAVAGTDEFPELAADVSFPYTPTFATEADATVKAPDWLNDPTVYHNRGNSTFSGESDTWGDFFGLDDLFTEDPRVVEGMIELYGDIIERYDVDGFRVDTMKHVNPEFWAAFAPAIRARATSLGKPDFLLFGEVFNQDPIQQSAFTNLGVTSTLDFIVNEALHGYVADGGNAQFLAQALDDDDWFTDADNNASMQVTFFGNHDEGRMGHAIEVANPGASDDELLARARLGHDLLFLLRGQPVVYYGDEQGFTGEGGDQFARQDMFPSLTPEYADDDSIGTDATPAADNFDTEHPLYRRIQVLSRLREQHAALRTGAQYVHDTDGPVLAFSRIDRDELVEVVVVTNNAAERLRVDVDVLSAGTEFSVLLGEGDGAASWSSDAAGRLAIEVAPLDTLVLVANDPLEPSGTPVEIDVVRPDADTTIPTPRYRIEAELGDRRYAEVTFSVSVDGGDRRVLGVDDAPPYRIYWNNAALAAGTTVELIATVDDLSGEPRSDTVTVTLGDRT